MTTLHVRRLALYPLAGAAIAAASSSHAVAAGPGDTEPDGEAITPAASAGGRAPAGRLTEQVIEIPSALPAGDADIDQIHLRFFPAPGARPDHRLPAVIIVPPIGSSDNDPQMKRAAKYLADRGVSAIVMTLPYHGERWPDDKGRADPGDYFLSPDVRRVVSAFLQSASDVETIVTWLERRPEVDQDQLGIIGISLGAIITHLVMGRDARINAGVALLGGGGIADLYRSSVLARVGRALHPAPDAPELSPAELRAAVRAIDPLTYADANRPRHVLMVAAARDIVVPPRDATRLWKALGEPPIQWVDANHFALSLTARSALHTSLAYLRSAWAPPSAHVSYHIPSVYAPTIKLGIIAQRGKLGITSALQWQFHSFARRPDHLSLAHADIGLSPRGSFLALGVTGGAYLDMGVASRVRLGRDIETPRPYVSLHFTF